MTTIDRVLQLVNESGLTAKDFAINAGLGAGNITDWKTGRSKPSIESLQKISKYANVSLEWLTGDSKFKNSEDTFNNYIENQITRTILKCFSEYHSEYVIPCNISEQKMNEIIEILLSTQKGISSKEVHENLNNFYSSFPTNKQKKIKEFTRIIIKEVIYVINSFNTAHSLMTLVDKQQNNTQSTFFNIPIVGKIAAGQPILAEQYIEGYLPVDPNIYGLSASDDLFYLLVSGDSMNQKVENGDYVLIHKQDYAEDGDIIVAIVNDDDEATLKRYKEINEQYIQLEPMSNNPRHQTRTIDLKTTKFIIIGKAIGKFGKF